MTTHRREKVAEQVLEVLASELRSLRDPRLQLVGLTDVQLSQDLKVAKVFWYGISERIAESARPAEVGVASEEGSGQAVSDSFLDSDEVREVGKALQRAGGHLKRRIGEVLNLRFIPELRFEYDDSLARGSRIDFLLAKTRSGR
ncbi:MAG: ribosome-binding factor A [Bdellovibrionales bacterium]|nr:ribosome-binding factor A [Bdellovibrionales bacterium]